MENVDRSTPRTGDFSAERDCGYGKLFMAVHTCGNPTRFKPHYALSLRSVDRHLLKAELRKAGISEQEFCDA